MPNSLKALRLTELAGERGLAAALHERLFDAYWARARDIGDDAVLVEEAVAAGLDEDEVRDLLATDRHLDQVHRQTNQALELGASGVPAWLIDERVLVPGAQPHEVFERVLGRLGYQPRPGATPERSG